MKKLLTILIIILLYGCANSNRTLKLANDVDKEQQWSIEDIKRADEYFEKGLGYTMKADNEMALLYYDTAIMIYPGTSYYTNRGVTKYELGDTIGAMNDYLEVLKIDSLDYTTISNMAGIYADYGNYENALKLLLKSESIDSEQAYIYMYIGKYQFLTGDYNDALKNFEKHVKSKYNTHLDYTFYMMGNCHEKLNEIQVAEVYWKKAAEMGYEDAITKMDSLKNLKK